MQFFLLVTSKAVCLHAKTVCKMGGVIAPLILLVTSKAVCLHAKTVCKMGGVIAPLILSLGSNRRWVVWHTLATLPVRKEFKVPTD